MLARLLLARSTFAFPVGFLLDFALERSFKRERQDKEALGFQLETDSGNTKKIIPKIGVTWCDVTVTAIRDKDLIR